MTGKQLKKLLLENGWTQVGMAKELRIGERTMRAHVKSAEVQRPIEIAILCVIQHRKKP